MGSFPRAGLGAAPEQQPQQAQQAGSYPGTGAPDCGCINCRTGVGACCGGWDQNAKPAFLNDPNFPDLTAQQPPPAAPASAAPGAPAPGAPATPPPARHRPQWPGQPAVPRHAGGQPESGTISPGTPTGHLHTRHGAPPAGGQPGPSTSPQGVTNQAAPAAGTTAATAAATGTAGPDSDQVARPRFGLYVVRRSA